MRSNIVIPAIRKHFQEKLADCLFKSYTEYYSALRDFIIENEDLIKADIIDIRFLDRLKLNTLLSLNLSKYDIENIGAQKFNLDRERELCLHMDYPHVESLLDFIANRLWEMVSTPANFECNCINGNVIFVMASGRKQPLAYCLYCGKIYDEHGIEMSGIGSGIYPATSHDIYIE